VRRRHAVSPRLVGLATAVAAIAFAVLTFQPVPLPWNSPFHMTVEAGAFGEINPGAWVELSGARVGSVGQVEPGNGYSVIHISVDRRYAAQLHADTSAAIRPHGLLGPKYVALSGGSSGSMTDGGTIPLSRTTVSTDVDQVLNALQPDVRQSLKTVFVELGRAAEGRGADMNAAIKALGMSSGDLSTTTSVLHNRDADLAALIVASEQLDRDLQNAPIDANIADTQQVLNGLVQVESSMGNGIDRTANVTRELDVALNGNSGNLARALAQGPAAVDRLRRLAVEVDAILVGVNPSLPSLMQAVMETKSAFQGQDKNGHYVRVQVVKQASGPGGGPQSAPSGPATSMAAPLTDEELLALFLGQ